MKNTNQFNVKKCVLGLLRRALPILIFAFLSANATAQNTAISGSVTDEDGTPLSGANIVEKGTTNGVTADFDGNFSINVINKQASLIVSYIGFATKEVMVNGQTNLNLTLSESAASLDEVVLIGYGTAKKSDLTGSIASVKGDVINSFSNASATQALQGRVSGVHIIQNSGDPGAAMQIRIRGTNSIRGDNNPLWIIDGFPGDQTLLNVSDIESLDVLKDASATAIYGSRGANGVIIVTTKRGKEGTTKVDYEESYTMQSVRKKLDLLNPTEYMQLMNIQQLNDYGAEYFSQAEINTGAGVDYQDLMFRSAPLQNRSITVSGGTEKTQFSIGGSYFDQKSIVKNIDGFKRISLRANVNHNISKRINLLFNAILTRIDKDDLSEDLNGGQKGTALFSSIIAAPPTLSPYNDNGYRNLGTAYPFTFSISNPLLFVNERTDKYRSNNIIANLAATFKPIDDLSIKISGNVMNSDSRKDYYISTVGYDGLNSNPGEATINTVQNLSLNSDNIVTYNKIFNSIHNFTAMGGVTYQENTITSLGASGNGFLSNDYETYDIAAANTINTPTSSYTKWNLLSYLGRLNYSYKSKYLATVSFRADGSSRYSEGNKWGYFPSGALAWRVSEEGFMKNIDLISNLKLKLGYGETGSTAISPYSTLSMLSSGKLVFGDNRYTYFAPSSSFPGDLRWETTAQSDIGLDIGLFENRLNFTADYYVKNTRDLLNPVRLPSSTGYSSSLRNVGKIQNKGLELLLDANIADSDFKWDVSANISFNRNKVVELYDGQDITGGSFGLSIVNDYVNLLREGEPLGVFYAYQEDGYDEQGLIKYKDNDNSGNITSEDKAIVGNPNPDFIYGFNSTMKYKNFELSWFIQGSQGNDIFNISTISHDYDYGIGFNMLSEVLYDHWTEDTPNAKYPKISEASTNGLKISDRFVNDGSYTRLKNIEIAFNIPVDNLSIKWLKRGQVYVSGQNLLTITKYPWWDPDVNSAGGGSSITQGVDHFTHPITKSITVGMKLGF
ncbi:TonB-dependent receptor [Maribacter sp. ANRC-HE7]|uniref:TonB-dependent receptor n=1 Tax=Maribacter aquimaris TaxID=2737171 RepID=A0ABR7V1K8_9FLAO|nr:TonB-dependent receptor [Maribacter aquimaris]MBD0777815.1 TonB-dependent receptor [Maribacter aquimaris]